MNVSILEMFSAFPLINFLKRVKEIFLTFCQRIVNPAYMLPHHPGTIGLYNLMLTPSQVAVPGTKFRYLVVCSEEGSSKIFQGTWYYSLAGSTAYHSLF